MKPDELLKIPLELETLNLLAGLCRLPPKIEAERQRLEMASLRLNNIRSGEIAEAPRKFPVKAKLYQHQIRAAEMALALFDTPPRGFGLLFEMGCGKTLTAIAILGALYQRRAIKRVLVVAPASVCAVWPKEFESYAAFPAHVRVLSGEQSKRAKVFEELSRTRGNGLHVLTINYEGVWRGQMLKRLMEWDPDVIIADESQRIKSPLATQSKAMHRLGDRARYKLILSGTPVQNNAEDLWSQYRFLDSSIFGTNFYAFRSRYAIMGGYENKKIIGYKRMDELVKKEYSMAYRVTKQEVMLYHNT